MQLDITLPKVISGVLMYLIIHAILGVGRRVLKDTERKLAIRTHYQDKTSGWGHNHRSIFRCTDGKCALL